MVQELPEQTTMGGAPSVMWGGRAGSAHMMPQAMRTASATLGRFLTMVVATPTPLGFPGQMMLAKPKTAKQPTTSASAEYQVSGLIPTFGMAPALPMPLADPTEQIDGT